LKIKKEGLAKSSGDKARKAAGMRHTKIYTIMTEGEEQSSR